MPLTAHGVTHPGRRSTNEDTLLVDVGRGLFAVADGMGGHRAGEVASELAIDTLRSAVPAGPAADATDLERALRVANERVCTAATRHPDYAGMGTTLVAVLVDGTRAVYASVGDSRIYYWHDGALSQLTRDDSWVATVLTAGEGLTAAQIQQHPMRHVLTRVIGLRADLDMPLAETTFGEGDALLLCSDGLHGSLPETAIAAAFREPRSVADLTQALLDQALARGATDNVTVVVVRCE
jgi:protein phosphatase